MGYSLRMWGDLTLPPKPWLLRLLSPVSEDWLRNGSDISSMDFATVKIL